MERVIWNIHLNLTIKWLFLPKQPHKMPFFASAPGENDGSSKAAVSDSGFRESWPGKRTGKTLATFNKLNRKPWVGKQRMFKEERK